MLLGDHLKSWDMMLCMAELAHNQSLNRSTGFNPFFVVYGMISRASVDLLTMSSLPSADARVIDLIKKLRDDHATTESRLEASTSKYKSAAGLKRRDVSSRWEFSVGCSHEGSFFG